MLTAKLRLAITPKIDRTRNDNQIRTAFHAINSLLWACPSMRNLLTDEFIAEAYEGAKYVLDGNIPLPEKCPYTTEQILKEIELRG